MSPTSFWCFVFNDLAIDSTENGNSFRLSRKWMVLVPPLTPNVTDSSYHAPPSEMVLTNILRLGLLSKPLHASSNTYPCRMNSDRISGPSSPRLWIWPISPSLQTALAILRYCSAVSHSSDYFMFLVSVAVLRVVRRPSGPLS